MRESRLRSSLELGSLVAVIGFVAVLAVLVCPFTVPITTRALRVLADRKFNPPHSFRSQVLSLAFQPIEFVLDSRPVVGIVSRDTRHWVYSITGRPNE